MKPYLTSFAVGLAMLAALPASGSAEPQGVRFPRAGFITPLQPWASPDGQIHLLRPIVARIYTSDAPLGSLMSPGWRMIWDGSPATPGRLIVRFVVKVVAVSPETSANEVLQVGVSRRSADVRTCLTYGLKGGSARRLPDRIINGRRYVAWRNGDAGMSQQVTATDLRARVGDACYAVERFAYGDSASEADPAITLSQISGAAMLDKALASLQLGPVRPDEVLRPPTVRLPAGAVAR